MNAPESLQGLSAAKQAAAAGRAPESLTRWVWRALVLSALVPLLAVELTLVAVYWLGFTQTYQVNSVAVIDLAREQLLRDAQREALRVQVQLEAAQSLLGVLAESATELFAEPFPESAHGPQQGRAPAADAAYAFADNGAYYSREDRGQGAMFYSGAVPIGPEQLVKAKATEALVPGLRQVVHASPLITQSYINTWDSLNRIYPYFDVIGQYPEKMNIPDYNFYYEADALHNPKRVPVWTGVYLDPAGQGWMASCIAPVYRGDFLEAVVGVDITTTRIVDEVLRMDLPWQGYGMLLDRDGVVIAAPAAGERDFELADTPLRDSAVVTEDTRRSEQFNLSLQPRLSGLFEAIAEQASGQRQVMLSDGEHLLSWQRIAGTGWLLLTVAPMSGILADADALHAEQRRYGLLMILLLIGFYVLFFSWLLTRARALTNEVAAPFQRLDMLIDDISRGLYSFTRHKHTISEVQRIEDSLATMSSRLGSAHHKLQQSESRLRQALRQQQRLSEAQRHFIDVVSHEFRTPLTAIDASAQTLVRRAPRMTSDQVVERAQAMRESARRLGEVLDSMLAFTRDSALSLSESAGKKVNLRQLCADVVELARVRNPSLPIEVDVSGLPEHFAGDAQMIRFVLGNALDTAAFYASADSHLSLHGGVSGERCLIHIRDWAQSGLSSLAEVAVPAAGEDAELSRMTAQVAGIGFGLAQTYAALHGGSLGLISEPGRGSQISLVLESLIDDGGAG